MKCPNCGAELERAGSRFHCRFCNTYFEDLDGKHENVVTRQGAFLSKCLDYEPEFFIPDGITMIGNGAFANNLSIEIVNLPKTIQHIGNNAFTGCTNLRKIYGMESVKFIGKEAFKNTGLENLTLPAGLIQLGEGCFSYCSKLETVQIF